MDDVKEGCLCLHLPSGSGVVAKQFIPKGSKFISDAGFCSGKEVVALRDFWEVDKLIKCNIQIKDTSTGRIIRTEECLSNKVYAKELIRIDHDGNIATLRSCIQKTRKKNTQGSSA